MEATVSENLSAEEVRRRRLAYFQSLTGKDKLPEVQEGTVIQNDISQQSNKGFIEKTPINTQDIQNSEQVNDIKQTDIKLQVRGRESHEKEEDGYNETVERLIQLTKHEIAERMRMNDEIKGEETPTEIDKSHSQIKSSAQSNLGEVGFRESAKHFGSQSKTISDFRHLKPQTSNDLHIEDIFSDRNNSFRTKQNVKNVTSLRESQENDTNLIFQKSVDVNQVEELGLSTHRPENVPKGKELHSGRSPRALDESMSEELKYALGERKYQEFLEKSMKDIDALYGENMKNKKGDKFDKGAVKDINVRREQYDKVTNVLMGHSGNETGNKSQNDPTRFSESLKHGESSTDGYRPLLNRPKHEPTSIYQNKRGFESEEKGEKTISRSKSVEETQSVSGRNFAFSADEIYSQAYQPYVRSPPMPISSSSGIGHGHPVTGMGPTQIYPQGFHPHPSFSHSHSFDGSFVPHQYSHYPAEYYMHQSSPGYYAPPPYGSPGSHPHGHPPMRTPRAVPVSPHHKGDNQMNYFMQSSPHAHFDDSPGRQMSARMIHSMDAQDVYRFRQQHPQMFPHPPGEHSFDSEMKPHLSSAQFAANPQHFTTRIPHPPESPPSSQPGPYGDMAAFQDYLHMMPKGIPYPPPPNDIELQAYFQHLGSQGYPIPYQSVIPPDSPRDEPVTGMMIPHPPAGKNERRLSPSHPRRREPESSRERSIHDGSPQREEIPKKPSDEKNDELSSSQRHIDGIRQYHEQRRQQQENEMLEKQRKFAKESIDRYFSSLEHHRGIPPHINDESTDRPMEILRESLTDVQTLVNSEATGVTLNAGGITDRMDDLGLDLSYLKSKEKENSEKAYKTKGDNSKTRTVIVCPECGEVNKPYMTWCSECSEVLIGIEPIQVKPKRKGTRGKKMGENEKNYVIHKNVTFDEPKISGSEQNFSDNEPEVCETKNSTSKMSPTKSEGRDSGRPSSEDVDINRTENEIDEICQSLSDPVIKGFIKAYFNKKRKELVTSTEYEEPVEYEDEPNYVDKDVKTVHNSIYHSENMNKHHFVEHINHKKHHEGINDEYVEKEKYFQPVESIESPVQFIKEGHLNNEDVWLHENRSPKLDVPMNKKHMPIDIEVFTMEESRQGRSSQRDPQVPSLILVNSSDEDENGDKRDKKPFVPLSMSVESEDWQEFFTKNKAIEIPDEDPIPESPGIPQDNMSKPFLAQLLEQQPKMSKRPPSASVKNKKSNPNTKSVVRESIEAPTRQRKWAKSNIGWNSYNPRELSTKSSISKSRPSSAGAKRPSSGVTRVTPTTSESDVPRRSGSMHNLSFKNNDDVISGRKSTSKVIRPVITDMSPRSDESSELPSPNIAVNKKDTSPDVPVRRKQSSDILARRKENASSESLKNQDSPKSLPYVIDHRLPAEDIEPIKDLGKVQHAYTVYQEMTPRIQQGKFSAWLCLPDEIMLQIFSFISHSDLVSVALTCKQYYRVAMDETLWRYITVKKKHDMDDSSLEHIGHRHPVSLALIQCHGDNITAKGLRELFRECSDTLRELNFCGCSRGALTGDCILLHASARCQNLTHIDASWCMVTDSGIGAISSSCKRLESLCINGCQNVTDEGLETVIKKHGSSLRVLEMFGCFKITPKGMRYLSTHCVNLLTLNLGQCYKLKDSCISQLSSSLGRIECLDLRGVKHIKDNCIRYIVKNCPRLKTIVLANCPNISDVALLEISTYLSDIRVIDVCGCRNITDNSIRALSNNCQNLRNIDISSTGCTHRSVSMLANFCNQRLEVAKLNFLADVTDAVVVKLVKHCKRLKLLHLYGCTSIKDLRKIQDLNIDLKVEM